MKNLDYGVIGNCKTAALISKEGSIDWLCFPNFDSPSVFSRLLDEKAGGSFAIQVDNDYEVTQKYLTGTNILCTTYRSLNDSFEVLDFMPRYHTADDGYYTPPEVHRYIRLVTGKPQLRIYYNPILNYARDQVKHIKYPDYIRTNSVENIRDNIYLYSSLEFEDILQNREITLDKDEYLLLAYSQKLVKIDIKRVYLEYQRTKVYWLNWDNRSRKFRKYNELVSRSLLILKLMSYQETGAVLAALTTSIPETIGEVRNWDYRFCWIRDASMSIETLLKMGHREAAGRYIGFVKSILRSKSDSFQIMYGINGERVLQEEILPNLAGYEDSRPVRIGNAAYTQRQNDSLGYLMDVFYRYYYHFQGSLDEIESMWEIVKSIIKTVLEEWKNPDQSIWEFRSKENHYVFSKVMCWVALDRAIKIAKILQSKHYENKWKCEAKLIKEEIMSRGWNPEIESFTQYYGGTDTDSSLLLMEYYGFIKHDNPQFIKTVHRIKKDLFHKGLMYRYKTHDDFGLPSSSFTICTFWLIRALFVIGEKEEALKIFEELISYSNHLRIFSEDLDFNTKRQLGNFPQAYSHLALINTAILFDEEIQNSRFIKP